MAIFWFRVPLLISFLLSVQEIAGCGFFKFPIDEIKRNKKRVFGLKILFSAQNIEKLRNCQRFFVSLELYLSHRNNVNSSSLRFLLASLKLFAAFTEGKITNCTLNRIITTLTNKLFRTKYLQTSFCKRFSICKDIFASSKT